VPKSGLCTTVIMHLHLISHTTVCRYHIGYTESRITLDITVGPQFHDRRSNTASATLCNWRKPSVFHVLARTFSNIATICSANRNASAMSRLKLQYMEK